MRTKMHEILVLKKFIDIKISDSKLKLKTCPNDKLINELFTLLDKAQKYNRSIVESNIETKINVGKTKTDIDAIVRVRNTLQQKINIISDLIISNSVDLDTVTLSKQRDSLIDEFIFLDGVIKKFDLETEVG